MIKKFVYWGLVTGFIYAMFAEGLHLFCYFVLDSQSCGALRVPLILGWQKVVWQTPLRPLFYGSGSMTFLYEVLFSLFVFTIMGLIIGFVVKIVKKNK